MDLLQSVRKEGSRGGVDFKWEDVRTSQHRENYLGHSLMAPVGRWQKGKDLNWYAKAGDAEKTPEEIEAEEKQRRKDEIKKVKEAEEDAMAKALGLPVPDRSANTEPLGESRISQKEITAALKDALGGDDEPQENKSSAMKDGTRDHAQEIGIEGIGMSIGIVREKIDIAIDPAVEVTRKTTDQHDIETMSGLEMSKVIESEGVVGKDPGRHIDNENNARSMIHDEQEQ